MASIDRGQRNAGSKVAFDVRKPGQERNTAAPPAFARWFFWHAGRVGEAFKAIKDNLGPSTSMLVLLGLSTSFGVPDEEGR